MAEDVFIQSGKILKIIANEVEFLILKIGLNHFVCINAPCLQLLGTLIELSNDAMRNGVLI